MSNVSPRMNKIKESCLVVFSGGQDSTTCLYWAKEVFSSVQAITFNYGQKHSIEIESARTIAKMAGVEHEVIDVPNCLVSMSPLTNPSAELERYDDYKEMDKIIGNRREKTFVPMRNTLFLTIAANRAEVLGIRNIVLGICEQDNANYDDCRRSYLERLEDAINYSLGNDHRKDSEAMRFYAPLIELSKADTVRLSRMLPGCWEALAYSHTSYDGKYPPTDKNHSNLLREQGFVESGFPDPLVLRAYEEGLMDLPNTANYKGFAKKKPTSYLD